VGPHFKCEQLGTRAATGISSSPAAIAIMPYVYIAQQFHSCRSCLVFHAQRLAERRRRRRRRPRTSIMSWVERRRRSLAGDEQDDMHGGYD
jgi:hypothetical protein